MIKRIIRFKEVVSTQDTAKRFIVQNEEVAVTSLCQTRGRGRQGRTWYSPLGGMYVSLLLLPRARFNLIPFMAALAIVRLIEDYGFKRVRVHWPNDILLSNKKVSGIICEQYKNALICGVGLNVNTEGFSKKCKNSTSLYIESGKHYDIEEILRNFIIQFNPLYEELQESGLKIKEVLNYIDGIGEAVEVVTAQGVIRGTVYDIDDDWALLLRDNTGMIKKFYYGDVRRLRW
jgi:BirA family biotin operon repressor/biotin-[acetyl-CoA-carboxylase] ligase